MVNFFLFLPPVSDLNIFIRCNREEGCSPINLDHLISHVHIFQAKLHEKKTCSVFSTSEPQKRQRMKRMLIPLPIKLWYVGNPTLSNLHTKRLIFWHRAKENNREKLKVFYYWNLRYLSRLTRTLYKGWC